MVEARRMALPLIALVAGLVGTLLATLLMAQAEEGRRQARFDGLVNGGVAAIETRMLVQLTLLRGTVGLFNASENVSRADFAAYVERLRLQQNYPGVLGIGFSAYADDPATLALKPRPPGNRSAYSAILYLEPQNRLNAEALGFDMLSEATRRDAMLAAARTGLAQMSGRVRLVQEIEAVKQPGFLIYAPVMRRGGGGLLGWVYSPLRAHDLFGAVFAGARLQEVAVEVFDEALAPEQLLYRSAMADGAAEYRSVRRLEVAGRTWLVRVTATPRFSADTVFPAPLGVALAGTLITLLITGLLLVQERAATRTEEVVTLRTAELRAANDRLRAEGEARKAAEATVAQMQKVEAIGQLTGGIAHDFNNMLTVVIGNLDIAQRRLDQPDRAGRAIAQASEGAQKAAELTQRLLAFGRQQALRPKVLNPSLLVEGMADMLRRTIGEAVRLETTLSPDIWTVCADTAQLESAILNLAINARDAMGQDGTLRIETRNAELRAGDLPQAEGPAVGAHVLIAVADTGHGMSPEIMARALDPFFTTKPVGKGTGLGLSQVYGFVRQSGGHLTIDSAVGHGTTVRIFLPRHEGQARAATEAMAATELPRARGRETILVVEDEDQVREISVETLAELGYDVIAAGGGAEALERIDERPDIRLLFTDVVMPEVNGRRLAQEALGRRGDLKVLFTTGYTPDGIVHDGRLDEDVVLLQKPFTAAELARTVRAVLDGE